MGKRQPPHNRVNQRRHFANWPKLREHQRNAKRQKREAGGGEHVKEVPSPMCKTRIWSTRREDTQAGPCRGHTRWDKNRVWGLSHGWTTQVGRGGNIWGGTTQGRMGGH
mmetsp:Transcript_71616/g.119983  ORF Transcript_71616/g.119983 Transcript_71616/m.119983 type:complete len:109 (+) Transcript_71616:344-670(+)